MKRFISIACAAAVLAACSAGGPTGCASSTNSPASGVLSPSADEKALYLAELSFAGAVLTVEKAVDAGVLKGERAQQASKILADAHGALQVARNAQVAGDTIQALTKADEASSLLSQLEPLTSP